MTEPARQGSRELTLKRLGDIKECGRTGASIKVFVATADGQFGAALVQFDRDRARTVAQIPEDARAGLFRRCVQSLHVMHTARAVIYLCDQRNGDLFIEGAVNIAVDQS